MNADEAAFLRVSRAGLSRIVCEGGALILYHITVRLAVSGKTQFLVALLRCSSHLGVARNSKRGIEKVVAYKLTGNLDSAHSGARKTNVSTGNLLLYSTSIIT